MEATEQQTATEASSTCEKCESPILLRHPDRTMCARCEQEAGLDPWRWAQS